MSLSVHRNSLGQEDRGKEGRTRERRGVELLKQIMVEAPGFVMIRLCSGAIGYKGRDRGRGFAKGLDKRPEFRRGNLREGVEKGSLEMF